MMDADVLQVTEWLMGAWAIGWCAGYTLYIVRRALEFL